MHLLLTAAKWLLFLTEPPAVPEPGHCAASITVNGECPSNVRR